MSAVAGALRTGGTPPRFGTAKAVSPAIDVNL